MTSEEWEELALAVALALKTFDWPRSDALCERIVGAIRSDPSGAAAPVGRILKRLRRARRFQSMALLADAMFVSSVASKALARSIVETVTSPGKTGDQHDVWRMGTELEAHIALNDWVRAADAAVRYTAAEEADAFQIASTLRQLTEVWELTSNALPGSQVLPMLRAALLAREGGGFRLEPHQVAADLKGSAGLEKVFGAGQFKTVKWYQHGLDCCESIARIETSEGNSEGTGWVCRADALFGNGSDKLLLVTNSHVVNAEGGEGALRFDKAAVRFEISGHVSRCSSIVWSSPIKECDATIVELDSLPPKVAGLSLSDEALAMRPPTEVPRRLYLIGYAGGRGPSFSLADDVMIACC